MAYILMRKFHRSFFKPFSGSDARQIPASGSALSIHRQGATVRTATTIIDGTYTVVPVANVGALAVGDEVQPGLDGNNSFTVEEIGSSGPTVTLSNGTGRDFPIAVGTRLVPLNNLPAVYSDENGFVALSPTAVPVDANGDCLFYCRTPRFDYFLAGGAFPHGCTRTAKAARGFEELAG